MSATPDPLQQPIRKQVGRTVSGSDRLRQLDDMQKFLSKVVTDETLRGKERDAFPLRKVVGRTRPR
jgi:hypothetical protein